MPNLYIIAGPNGAGKTTSAMVLLPEVLGCLDFVNADNIAAGLSPFQPEKSALAAGRIMLKQIDELLAKNVDFAFETTLASRSFVGLLEKAKKSGYKTNLFFLYLSSYELAQARVANRVKEGGHNIEKKVIKRRFFRGISNLFSLYMNKVDNWFVYGADSKTPTLIAQKIGKRESVFKEKLWHELQRKK